MKELLDSDKHNLFNILCEYPKDVRNAYNIIKGKKFTIDTENINKIVYCGMGGSAIAGDIVQTFFNYGHENLKKITFFVNRGYELPVFTDNKTLVILNSYSGNTEETLEAAASAIKITDKILVFSSGGEISQFADKHIFDLVELPTGFQPRCALNYSLLTLIGALISLGFLKFKPNLSKIVDEIEANYIEKCAQYSDLNDENPALFISEDLCGRIPIIYTENKYYGAVSLRYRQHFQENSKNLAFGNVLPEMNHNEINSLNYPKDLLTRVLLIAIRDEEAEHPRVNIRFEAFEELLKEKEIDLIQFYPEGSCILTRMFDAFYFSDWLSYYLAMINEVDPTEIPMINYLKDYLSKK